MARALVWVMLMVPVCAAVATSVGLVSADVLITGEPFTGGEAGYAVVFLIGPIFVVAYSVYAATRPDARSRLVATVLIVGGLVGAVAGVAFGWKVVSEKHAFMARRVAEACGWIHVPDCESRAVDCIHAVDRAEPVVERGVGNPEDEEIMPGVPNTSEARAIYRCLRQR